MKEAISENEARYCVVQLLYRGKVQEAEQALDNLVKESTISRENEAFYRTLIKGAHAYLAEVDTCFPDIEPRKSPQGC